MQVREEIASGCRFELCSCNGICGVDFNVHIALVIKEELEEVFEADVESLDNRELNENDWCVINCHVGEVESGF